MRQQVGGSAVAGGRKNSRCLFLPTRDCIDRPPEAPEPGPDIFDTQVMVSRRQGARRIDEFVEAGAEERGEAEGRATPEPASWCAARAVAAAAAAACCCWCRCAAGPQVRKISLPAAGQDWRRVRGPVAGSAALRRGRSKKLEMHSRVCFLVRREVDDVEKRKRNGEMEAAEQA